MSRPPDRPARDGLAGPGTSRHKGGMTDKPAPLRRFTGYQTFLVALLAMLQFTIILDFMIISPLGALVMPALKITPSQFGVAVSF